MSRPDANSAAETVSPSRVATATPSTKICTVGLSSLSDRLNIGYASWLLGLTSVISAGRCARGCETTGGECSDQFWLERTGCNHARDFKGVVGGKRDAGMAARHKCAGRGFRKSVNR